jgi:cold shock CspA family protein
VKFYATEKGFGFIVRERGGKGPEAVSIRLI